VFIQSHAWTIAPDKAPFPETGQPTTRICDGSHRSERGPTSPPAPWFTRARDSPLLWFPRNPLSDLVNRRQQARPVDRTGVDGVAHVHVNRRAEALNRRESDLDRGLEIAGLKLRWN